MTCDEKITVILNFFSQKVFISLVTPLRYYTRMSAFFSNPRNTSETLFWYLGVFSVGKRKKSVGAKSDEYDG